MALLASPTSPPPLLPLLHPHTHTHTRIDTCCWCELITHIWFLVSMRFMFPLGHCSNLDSGRIVLVLALVRTLLDLWPALKPRTLCAAAAEIYAPSQILYLRATYMLYYIYKHIWRNRNWMSTLLIYCLHLLCEFVCTCGSGNRLKSFLIWHCKAVCMVTRRWSTAW